MKKLFLIVLVLGLLSGCAAPVPKADIAATTLPVYEFTARLCEGSGLTVTRLVTESVSCLHDYSLQVSQMRAIETADAVVINGAGLEEFLADSLAGKDTVIDASADLELLCGEDEHDDHAGHHHAQDPHIWLSPVYSRQMCRNICRELTALYPEYEDIFQANLAALVQELDALQAYGEDQLAELSCRELITFHDGFAYLADSFNLTVLEAVEEESGSEASARELIALIGLVENHDLPAIFRETNGSVSAARIISAETGAKIFTLDMAMAGSSYFEAMYRNIDTLKEALE